MEIEEEEKKPFPEWLNIPGVDRAALGIEGGPRGQTPLRNARGLRIEAFAVAAGEDSVDEIPVFFETLDFHYPDARVYFLTDEAGAKKFGTLDLDCEVYVDVISQEDQEALSEKVTCVDHGERWSRRWIACKLEALRRAVEKWECGVLFCDSDLVFTQRLPDLSWDADLVLSSHTGPHWPNVTPAFHGFWNAGILLTNHLDIVDRWIELYRRGEGTFYEQHLLEKLAGEYVTDTFPSAWNWGGWRWSEDLSKSGRVPPILHCHIVGRWESQGRGRTKAVKNLAKSHLARVRESREIPKKWAFIHNAKASGSSFSSMIWKDVVTERGFQYLDSYTLGLQRDWRPVELDLIRTGELWGQVGDRHIVHNHAQHWPEKAVENMIGDGWQFVALYRPVRDRLVSFWFWNLRSFGERGFFPMVGPINDADSLDDFLNIILEDPFYEPEWALPSFAEKLEHWYRANSDGLRNACRDLWNVEADPIHANASQNPGWQACIDQGLIQQETVDRVENDPRVQAWDDFARSRGWV